jgi:formylglycine-generating enzyme required for sulfatase activity
MKYAFRLLASVVVVVGAMLSALFVFGRPVWSAMTTQGDRPAGAQAQSSWRPASGKKVGDTIRNPKDGATLVWVPAGAFTMGSDSGESDARPARKVTLSGYWIYKTEVTVAQYRKYCDATGADMPEDPGWGWKDAHPIVNVTWDDATAYSAWAGVSLPTEAQWEKAARGTDGREYPWGSGWSAAKCVNDTGGGASSTLPVGSKPAGASPYGCQDMAGNAWEWCADWYSDGYYASAPDRNPTGPAQGEYRVLRGGSWNNNNADNFRAHYRNRNDPDNRKNNQGFRCVSPEGSS